MREAKRLEGMTLDEVTSRTMRTWEAKRAFWEAYLDAADVEPSE